MSLPKFVHVLWGRSTSTKSFIILSTDDCQIKSRFKLGWISIYLFGWIRWNQTITGKSQTKVYNTWRFEFSMLVWCKGFFVHQIHLWPSLQSDWRSAVDHCLTAVTFLLYCRLFCPGWCHHFFNTVLLADCMLCAFRWMISVTILRRFMDSQNENHVSRIRKIYPIHMSNFNGPKAKGLSASQLNFWCHKFDYDAENPRAFRPLKLDMWAA